jgi:hypothetical protein
VSGAVATGPGTARFFVDPWDPGYGSALAEAAAELDRLNDSSADLKADVELPAAGWRPLDPPPGAAAPDPVFVVDGVRRIDARVWIDDPASPAPQLGVAASWGAGVVRLDGAAEVVTAQVRRALFTAAPGAADIVTPVAAYPVRMAADGAPDKLSLALQQRLAETELEVSAAARGTAGAAGDLLLLDGPLRGRTRLPRTVGYVKTHHAAYLPTALSEVVTGLAPGQRTPLFTIGSSWIRHSWYLCLPGRSAAPWAGVVRCECSADLRRDEAAALADATCLLLPRLASTPHKDPRAPQNLVPIGGLEKLLRHRLGDARVLHRALTAAGAAGAAVRPVALGTG